MTCLWTMIIDENHYGRNMIMDGELLLAENAHGRRSLIGTGRRTFTDGECAIFMNGGGRYINQLIM